MKNRLVFRMLSGQRKQKKRRGKFYRRMGVARRGKEKKERTLGEKSVRNKDFTQKNLKNSSQKTDQTLDRKRPL